MLNAESASSKSLLGEGLRLLRTGSQLQVDYEVNMGSTLSGLNSGSSEQDQESILRERMDRMRYMGGSSSFTNDLNQNVEQDYRGRGIRPRSGAYPSATGNASFGEPAVEETMEEVEVDEQTSVSNALKVRGSVNVAAMLVAMMVTWMTCW